MRKMIECLLACVSVINMATKTIIRELVDGSHDEDAKVCFCGMVAVPGQLGNGDSCVDSCRMSAHFASLKR